MSLRIWLSLICVSFLWATSFPIYRYTIAHYDAISIASLRIVIAGFTVIFMALLSGEKGVWRHVYQNKYKFFILSIFNLILPFSLLAFLSSEFNSGESSLVNATAPFWGILLAWLFLKEGITIFKILGLIVGLCGIAIIASQGDAPLFEGNKLIAFLAGISATACYGISVVLIRRHSESMRSKQIVLGALLFGGMISVPMLYIFWPAQGFLLIDFILISFTGVFGTAIAYQIFFYMIKEVGASKSIMTTYLVPVFSVILGVIFLGEVVGIMFVVSAFLILLGIYLSTTDFKFSKNK